MALNWGFRLDSRTMALIIIVVAMGIAGRLAFIWLPNVMLSYFIVAVIAIAYGPVLGSLVGALTMLLTDMLVGFTPISLFTITGLAIFGLTCGLLGRATGLHRRNWSPLHAVAAAVLGSGLVVVYSLFTDLGSTLFFIGGGGEFMSKYLLVAAAGLAFNIPSMVFNAALFGLALHPVIRAINMIEIGELEHDAKETTG